MLALLAEGTAGETSFWVGTAAVLGTLFGVVAKFTLDFVQKKHDLDKDAYSTLVEQYQKVVQGQEQRMMKVEKERDAALDENRKLTNEIRECLLDKQQAESLCEILRGRVRRMRRDMEENGLKVDSDDDLISPVPRPKVDK